MAAAAAISARLAAASPARTLGEGDGGGAGDAGFLRRLPCASCSAARGVFFTARPVRERCAGSGAASLIFVAGRCARACTGKGECGHTSGERHHFLSTTSLAQSISQSPASLADTRNCGHGSSFLSVETLRYVTLPGISPSSPSHTAPSSESIPCPHPSITMVCTDYCASPRPSRSRATRSVFASAGSCLPHESAECHCWRCAEGVS